MNPNVKWSEAGVNGGDGRLSVVDGVEGQSSKALRKYGDLETRIKRWEEKMAVVFSCEEEKLPVSAMRTSEYSRDRHMKTRSFLSLSIRMDSGSSCSSPSDESKRNSNASPNPWLVYKYSSSLEKSVGLIDVVRRRGI